MALFSPSMMCADCMHLSKEIKNLEKAGVDRLHLDMMDGVFVPNFALGLNDIKGICSGSVLPKEVHLMIKNPSSYVDLFISAGADILYFHPEADYNPTTVVEKVKKAGAKPGIVLSPGTSVETVMELLYIVDHVLVMGVNPGHAGQVYLPYVDHKLNKLISLKDKYQFEICMDGACTEEMILRWAPRGVDGFVLGTAALFGKTEDYSAILHHLRSILKRTYES